MAGKWWKVMEGTLAEMWRMYAVAEPVFNEGGVIRIVMANEGR